MPVLPSVQALIDFVDAHPQPPLSEITPVESRERLRRITTIFGGPTVSVGHVQERTIPGPGSEVPLRIYTPRGSGPFAAVIYFHGGGWVQGDLDTHDQFCRMLCDESEMVVVAVDYRLAPEHPYPAGAEDCYAAAVWAADHPHAIDVDADRLAVMGDSAGANLAAVVALMARDRNGPALRLQVPLFPVTDYDFTTTSYTANAQGYLLEKASMEWYWGHYVRDEAEGREPYASPLRAADLSGVAAAHVVTAEFDPLVDEGEAYADRLAAAGVPTTRKCYVGQVHFFTHLPGAIPEANEARGEIVAALQTALNT
jgi:acetyl esterase